MRTLITCLFTLYPPNSPYFTQGSQREKEFVEGFRRFRKIYEEYLNEDFTVLLIENSVKSIEDIPQSIWDELLPAKWSILLTQANDFGVHNKGAGILENYNLVANGGILQDFDWAIHFEPRLTLKDAFFFEKFIASPGSYFTKANDNQYFTGLFSMKTENLIDFISLVDVEKMVQTKTSLEDIIFQYMKDQQPIELEKVSCTWHDAYTKKCYEF